MAKKILKEKNIAKDIKVGIGGQSFLPYWDEQRNLYGVEAFQLISKRLESIWGDCAQEKNPKERIPLRHRIVEKYKKELRSDLFVYIGDMEVQHLFDGEELMGLDDYYGKLVPEIERLFDEGKDEQSIWHMSIDVMHDLSNAGANPSLIFREFDNEVVFHDIQYQTVNVFQDVRVEKEFDEREHYTKDYLYNFYCLYRGKLAFRVCRFVYEWYALYVSDDHHEYEDGGGDMGYLSGREIATYAEAICLYIALSNEQNKLKEEAELRGISLKDATKPKEQTKKESNAETAMERGKKYFQRAIDKGMMREASKDKGERGLYRWTYEGGSLISLAYFLKKIYTPNGYERIPAEALGEMFGVDKKSLSSSVNQAKDHPPYDEIDALFVD